MLVYVSKDTCMSSLRKEEEEEEAEEEEEEDEEEDLTPHLTGNPVNPSRARGSGD